MAEENLQSVLQQLYARYDNEALIALLQKVAQKLQQAHAAQLLPQIKSMQDVHVAFDGDMDIDFATQRSDTPLNDEQRAQSLAVINLPDDYWRIFKYMYFNDQIIPDDFNHLVDDLREQARQQLNTQDEQNIWLWDEKSAQAMIVLHSKSKKRFRSKSDYLKIATNVLLKWTKLNKLFKKNMQVAFQQSLKMQSRVGVAVHPNYQSEEGILLKKLDNIPVLIRFYCHESESKWQQGLSYVQQLSQERDVAVALVQHRDAVFNKELWHNFCKSILSKLPHNIAWVEIGHASNRVKWGIWQRKEYLQLVDIAAKIANVSSLKIIAPAVIDFEWYRLLDFLLLIGKKIKLWAASIHLYVDRRGAPENFQGKFSSLEKVAMCNAITKTGRNMPNKVIISEVNWPLQGTGIYSPIGSPYTAPEWFRDNPGVTEDDYANYLIRYLVICLCSGFIEQIMIWRLSAHGYGLVDDLDDFRERPAFKALQFWQKTIAPSTFIKKIETENNIYLLVFETKTKIITLGWSTQKKVRLEAQDYPGEIFTRDGEPMEAQDLHLTDKPIYIIESKDN